jgi:hypothetical protein
MGGVSKAVGGYVPRKDRRASSSPADSETSRSGRFTEIQYLAGERWVTERLFGQHLQMTGPACHIARAWDEILSVCPGRSWRMVLTEAGEPCLVMYGPTAPVPGGRWGPAPWREYPLLQLGVIPFAGEPRPQPRKSRLRADARL